MSSTQHQLIEQCATRLRGIVEALDNIHDTSPHRWSTDLDDVHSSAESLLALIKDQAPARSETSFEEWLANELEGEDGQPVPAAVCDIALARRAFNHWPKLEQPAKVGGVRFSAGVSSRLVVEAAQRLYEFESTPEQEAERIERLQAFREQLDPLNLAPHAKAFNEAPAEALRPEQAEAERSALWAVHAQGPDELYAAFSREDAEKHAAELNALPMPEGIAVGAVVVPSPWPAVQHWQYLAEQEQDHKNEIAGRLRQHERIGEALRAEITQLRQHKNDYMDAGQETYRALQNEIREREAEIARLDGLVSGHTAERDAALARVAELERQEPVGWEWIEVFVGGNFDGEEADNGFYRGTDKENILPSIEGTEVRQRPLYAAPVAQAQHSVPGDIMRDAQRYRWLRDQQFYFSFSTENSDAGISSCTAGMSSRFKNLSWVDAAIDSAIAAAPGNSVPQAWLDVQAERRRQITAEGWTPEHDDLYCAAELPRAAAAYILNGANDEAPAIWPFVAKWWKPRDSRSNYVRAGALILAEIERLDRAAPGKEVGHE
ncbi:hypothetical protein [Pseudomonas aeruginosa]|uniref:hypothetical protein n=1 Tax=Pseudomonas aeruginosa TaxID=287 RepID=UPI002FE0402F